MIPAAISRAAPMPFSTENDVDGEMMEHMSSHPCHRLSIPAARMYWCRHCMKTFENPITRWRHSKTCLQLSLGKFRKDKDGSTMQVFLTGHRSVGPGQSPRTDLKCFICKTVFLTIDEMRAHVRTPCRKRTTLAVPKNKVSALPSEPKTSIQIPNTASKIIYIKDGHQTVISLENPYSQEALSSEFIEPRQGFVMDNISTTEEVVILPDTFDNSTNLNTIEQTVEISTVETVPPVASKSDEVMKHPKNWNENKENNVRKRKSVLFPKEVEDRQNRKTSNSPKSGPQITLSSPPTKSDDPKEILNDLEAPPIKISKMTNKDPEDETSPVKIRAKLLQTREELCQLVSAEKNDNQMFPEGEHVSNRVVTEFIPSEVDLFDNPDSPVEKIVTGAAAEAKLKDLFSTIDNRNKAKLSSPLKQAKYMSASPCKTGSPPNIRKDSINNRQNDKREKVERRLGSTKGDQVDTSGLLLYKPPSSVGSELVTDEVVLFDDPDSPPEKIVAGAAAEAKLKDLFSAIDSKNKARLSSPLKQAKSVRISPKSPPNIRRETTTTINNCRNNNRKKVERRLSFTKEGEVDTSGLLLYMPPINAGSVTLHDPLLDLRSGLPAEMLLDETTNMKISPIPPTPEAVNQFCPSDIMEKTRLPSHIFDGDLLPSHIHSEVLFEENLDEKVNSPVDDNERAERLITGEIKLEEGVNIKSPVGVDKIEEEIKKKTTVREVLSAEEPVAPSPTDSEINQEFFRKEPESESDNNEESLLPDAKSLEMSNRVAEPISEEKNTEIKSEEEADKDEEEASVTEKSEEESKNKSAKLFKCKACSNTFKTSQALQKHSRIPCKVKHTRSLSQKILRPKQPCMKIEKKPIKKKMVKPQRRPKFMVPIIPITRSELIRPTVPRRPRRFSRRKRKKSFYVEEQNRILPFVNVLMSELSDKDRFFYKLGMINQYHKIPAFSEMTTVPNGETPAVETLGDSLLEESSSNVESPDIKTEPTYPTSAKVVATEPQGIASSASPAIAAAAAGCVLDRENPPAMAKGLCLPVPTLVKMEDDQFHNPDDLSDGTSSSNVEPPYIKIEYLAPLTSPTAGAAEPQGIAFSASPAVAPAAFGCVSDRENPSPPAEGPCLPLSTLVKMEDDQFHDPNRCIPPIHVKEEPRHPTTDRPSDGATGPSAVQSSPCSDQFCDPNRCIPPIRVKEEPHHPNSSDGATGTSAAQSTPCSAIPCFAQLPGAVQHRSKGINTADKPSVTPESDQSKVLVNGKSLSFSNSSPQSKIMSKETVNDFNLNISDCHLAAKTLAVKCEKNKELNSKETVFENGASLPKKLSAPLQKESKKEQSRSDVAQNDQRNLTDKKMERNSDSKAKICKIKQRTNSEGENPKQLKKSKIISPENMDQSNNKNLVKSKHNHSFTAKNDVIKPVNQCKNQSRTNAKNEKGANSCNGANIEKGAKKPQSVGSDISNSQKRTPSSLSKNNTALSSKNVMPDRKPLCKKLTSNQEALSATTTLSKKIGSNQEANMCKNIASNQEAPSITTTLCKKVASNQELTIAKNALSKKVASNQEAPLASTALCKKVASNQVAPVATTSSCKKFVSSKESTLMATTPLNKKLPSNQKSPVASTQESSMATFPLKKTVASNQESPVATTPLNKKVASNQNSPIATSHSSQESPMATTTSCQKVASNKESPRAPFSLSSKKKPSQHLNMESQSKSSSSIKESRNMVPPRNENSSKSLLSKDNLFPKLSTVISPLSKKVCSRGSESVSNQTTPCQRKSATPQTPEEKIQKVVIKKENDLEQLPQGKVTEPVQKSIQIDVSATPQTPEDQIQQVVIKQENNLEQPQQGEVTEPVRKSLQIDVSEESRKMLSDTSNEQERHFSDILGREKASLGVDDSSNRNYQVSPSKERSKRHFLDFLCGFSESAAGCPSESAGNGGSGSSQGKVNNVNIEETNLSICVKTEETLNEDTSLRGGSARAKESPGVSCNVLQVAEVDVVTQIKQEFPEKQIADTKKLAENSSLKNKELKEDINSSSITGDCRSESTVASGECHSRSTLPSRDCRSKNSLASGDCRSRDCRSESTFASGDSLSKTTVVSGDSRSESTVAPGDYHSQRTLTLGECPSKSSLATKECRSKSTLASGDCRSQRPLASRECPSEGPITELLSEKSLQNSGSSDPRKTDATAVSPVTTTAVTLTSTHSTNNGPETNSNLLESKTQVKNCKEPFVKTRVSIATQTNSSFLKEANSCDNAEKKEPPSARHHSSPTTNPTPKPIPGNNIDSPIVLSEEESEMIVLDDKHLDPSATLNLPPVNDTHLSSISPSQSTEVEQEDIELNIVQQESILIPSSDPSGYPLVVNNMTDPDVLVQYLRSLDPSLLRQNMTFVIIQGAPEEVVPQTDDHDFVIEQTANSVQAEQESADSQLIYTVQPSQLDTLQPSQLDTLLPHQLEITAEDEVVITDS